MTNHTRSWIIRVAVVVAAVAGSVGLFGSSTASATPTYFVQTLPVAPIGATSALTSVSCPSDGSCLGVGTTVSSGSTIELTEVLSGGTWTPTAVTPTGITSPNLTSVWCASVTSCVAAGSYAQSPGSSVTHAMVQVLSGGTWTIYTGLELAGTASSTLGGITCTAITSCVAVGSYTDTLGGAHSLFETLAAGVWVPSTGASDPSGATSLDLAGVQCSGSTSCLAVGDWSTGSSTNVPLLETLSGSTWSASELGVAGDVLTSLSCPSAGSCLAAGGVDAANSVIEILGSGSWIREEIQAPPGTSLATISGVSCPTTVNSCVMVGGYRSPATNTYPDALVETLSGGVWYQSIGLDPPGTYVLPQGVTCPDINSCVGVGVAHTGTGAATQIAASVQEGGSAPFDGSGYWLTASDGGVFNFGNAGYFGSTGSIHLNKPIVGMAATPDGRGYWLVASDGGVFSFGDAGYFGSTGAIALNKPIVGMASTPDGGGYWLVASDGGIFNFGDAGFYGSLGSYRLNQPIVGMASTPDGHGYWLVASDGGIFALGDAGFHGSTGAIALNKPIVGMAATPNGDGYWLVASDGGIFNFGDAGFYGSLGSIRLNKPIVGMSSTPDGGGYWLVASDGGIFNLGDAGFYGSTGATALNKPIVGMAGG
jgi:hypothetical protein